MSRVWSLPFALPDDVIDRARAVRLLVLDVDGVLTDGSVTFGPQGEEYKSFHVHDGQGIKSLREHGIETAVISARSSGALTSRAFELGIRNIETGVSDKPGAFENVLRNCALGEDQCCYVGDDLPDVPVMLRCNLAVAVADAHHSVRHIAHWVTPSGGGRGAVRDVCDAVLYAQGKLDAMMDRHLKLSQS